MQQTPITTGLTAQQVRQREQAGQINVQQKRVSKSIARILFDNLFTFFNLMNALLGAMILSVGSYKNALFLLVILFNTAIGIAQELRAKRTLDRLSLLTEAKVTALRDGRESQIELGRLVLDDIMVLAAGQQICADAVVREGTIEVNESLLTGEADAVLKGPGDALLSGSYILSGKARAQAVRVGADAYANQLAAEAKTFKRHPSQLRDALNRILKMVGVVIVPLGAGLFLREYFGLRMPVPDVVVSTVAAVLGMVPEGLVLLTSVALAVGVINLGQQRTLVRELFCIETLARVDVMCLDKTGTLTEGHMRVMDVIPLGDAPVDEIVGNLVRVLPDENETFQALKRRFEPMDTLVARDTLAFSSARKYSAARFDGQGALFIGAYEYLFSAEHHDPELIARIERHAGEGTRVLTLARGGDVDLSRAAAARLEPLALLLIADTVRPEAADVLSYFREQNTRLIVLSGDHPATAANIAAKVGFPGADRYVDASALEDDAALADAVERYSIFGRVRPAQKKQIVQALRDAGHTVAMIGDGVNDVPALKAADCSIAMAQGSDAAKQCANLVLLDSNFAALPHVVREGRRVVNNIQSASSLFLVKTIFSVLLTAAMLILGSSYPFMPIQLTLIGACAVGIPGAIFALEPNFDRIGPDFFGSVLRHALSGALTVVAWVCVSTAACWALGLSEPVRSTMCMITTGIASMYLIPRVYPLSNTLRKVVFHSMFALFLGALLCFRGLLQMEAPGYAASMLLIAMVIYTPPMLEAMSRAADAILAHVRR